MFLLRLIESTNTKIRALKRPAFGFRSSPALIGLAMLALGWVPPNPGRPHPLTSARRQPWPAPASTRPDQHAPPGAGVKDLRPLRGRPSGADP
jgi:hypothetical protein